MSDIARQREQSALAAIRTSFGSTDEDDSVKLFISHHLEEIGSDFWKQHLGVESPDPSNVLDILQLRNHWGGDDDLEVFDFTLPGEITQYVISVRFDDSGLVEEISMES